MSDTAPKKIINTDVPPPAISPEEDAELRTNALNTPSDVPATPAISPEEDAALRTNALNTPSDVPPPATLLLKANQQGTIVEVSPPRANLLP